MLLLALVAGCSGSSAPPADVSAAVAVVGYFAGPRYINVSMYSATAETGTPSELVSYLFSTMGAAERPETYRMDEKDSAHRGGPPGWPEGVGFYPLKPNPRGGKQVVIFPDDARGMIIAEGYVNPAEKPVLRSEFEMAKPVKRR
jgi:hypothetical protein